MILIKERIKIFLASGITDESLDLQIKSKIIAQSKNHKLDIEKIINSDPFYNLTPVTLEIENGSERVDELLYDKIDEKNE